MKFNLKKFILGFIPVDGEHLGKVLNIVVWLVIGGVIIWKLFIQPTQNDIQKIQTDLRGANIEHLHIEPKQEDQKRKDFWLDPYAGYHIRAKDFEVGIILDW